MTVPDRGDGPSRPGADAGTGQVGLWLLPLGPEHDAAILAGQDPALAREISGAPWTPATLSAFLGRCAGWSTDGPLRELAALDTRTGVLLGGGGIARLGPGIDRGEATLSYWLLAAHRGRGLGHVVAAALVALAAQDPRIDRLVLRIAPDNPASQAVARQLGAAATGREEPHPAGGGRRARRWELALRR
ncbi:GNAT family N-acetyltransferase [Brachybacterium squillarum]|uniref:GNAT family N-acetyltransferase n=1 Tax=Brachybacterium squillarum TaxID=661979 RepID=UPI00026298B8|nr:GNAT family N-acetyltransferase [Brachybacterium squillarum]